MLRGVLAFIFGDGTPDDLLGLLRGLIGKRERRIVGEPNIDVGPVLNVFRKKLTPQACGEEASEHKKTEGEREHGPTKADRGLSGSVIGSVEAPLAAFGDGRLLLLRRAEQIVAE